jgi:predicted secreted Zn-dependent protease
MLQLRDFGKASYFPLHRRLILDGFNAKIPQSLGGNMRILAVALGVSIAAWAPTAGAGTIATTRYDYYAISGKTLVDIYDSMLRRGPHVDGAKAYASTSATSSQEGKLVGKNNCRIEDYRLKIDFVIRLPKIKDDTKLSSAERTRFQRFSQFLKKHEETHRSIWLECAAKLEAKVERISVKSCNEAESRSEKLWAEMRRSCNQRHQAFDAAEQKRLLQHPFLRYVLTKKSKSVNAAAAP